MKYTRIIILLAIMNLISNCLIWPLPDFHEDEINQLQGQIAVGSTTREEVISILGEPNVSRDNWIMYTRRIYKGGVFFMMVSPGPDPIGYPHQGGGASFGVYGKEFMDLYFEFDNYGTLTEFRTDKYDLRLRSDKDDWDPSKWYGQNKEDISEEVCDPGMESCP